MAITPQEAAAPTPTGRRPPFSLKSWVRWAVTAWVVIPLLGFEMLVACHPGQLDERAMAHDLSQTTTTGSVTTVARRGQGERAVRP